jgi:3',5'-cyclic AMP phosphodiesterase CpdA
MKIIAHVSDMHFGTEDPEIAAALFDELSGGSADRPTLVAVSGDLTQRAREREFRAARAYLDRLPVPYLAVPGNHDVPLYNVFTRFTDPMKKYLRYMDASLMPLYVDDELAVVGVNTARGFTFKNGKITRAKAERVAAVLADQGHRWKAVVAHHPFVVPAGVPERDRVDGAVEALPILEDAGVEMILSGHLHAAYATDAAGFRSDDHRIIAAHAGTCISTRTRGEANGYNTMTIDGDEITLVHRVWDGKRFTPSAAKTYRRRGSTIVKTGEAAIRDLPARPSGHADRKSPR